MSKSIAPHELILFYMVGFKPQDLVKMGYNETTVYRYKDYYEKAKISVLKRLKFNE